MVVSKIKFNVISAYCSECAEIRSLSNNFDSKIKSKLMISYFSNVLADVMDTKWVL